MPHINRHGSNHPNAFGAYRYRFYPPANPIGSCVVNRPTAVVVAPEGVVVQPVFPVVVLPLESADSAPPHSAITLPTRSKPCYTHATARALRHRSFPAVCRSGRCGSSRSAPVARAGWDPCRGAPEARRCPALIDVGAVALWLLFLPQVQALPEEGGFLCLSALRGGFSDASPQGFVVVARFAVQGCAVPGLGTDQAVFAVVGKALQGIVLELLLICVY